MSGFDPFTVAWEEAAASAAPGIEIYDTMELIHPSFIDGGVPFTVKCVNGTPVDQSFKLEDEAQIGGGTYQTFKAINFYADLPEFSEGQTPQTKIAVDNVGEEIMPYLEDAVSSRADLIAIWRQYRADDFSEPCYGPIEFKVKKVTANSTRLEGLAQLDNLSNKKFPKELFTYEKFPGLMNG